MEFLKPPYYISLVYIMKCPIGTRRSLWTSRPRFTIFFCLKLIDAQFSSAELVVIYSLKSCRLPIQMKLINYDIARHIRAWPDREEYLSLHCRTQIILVGDFSVRNGLGVRIYNSPDKPHRSKHSSENYGAMGGALAPDFSQCGAIPYLQKYHHVQAAIHTSEKVV